MAESARSIEIDDDMPFQRRSWMLERIAWGVLGLLVLAALAGLFGSGLLSSATANEDGLEVRYDRFMRLHGPSNLEVTAPVEGGEVRLSISAGYLDDLQVNTISPEPESVEAGDDGHVYVFAASEEASELVVVFDTEPERIGRLRGEIAVEGGPQVGFTQFVYP